MIARVTELAAPAISIVVVSLMMIAAPVHAQEVPTAPRLSLADALEIGLERNHGIRLARNRVLIDRAELAQANAAFFPRFTIAASHAIDADESWVRLPDGEERTRSGTGATDASIGVGWTIFDGLRSIAERNLFVEQERLGNTELRIAVERTARDIVEAYYTIAREQHLLGVLQDAVVFSEERLAIARTMRELGSITEYDVLLARTDLNTDRAAALRQEAVVERTRLMLVELAGIPSDTTFDVGAEIPLPEVLDEDGLLISFEDGNRELVVANHLVRMAEHQHSATRRDRLPTVTLQGGYDISRDDPRWGVGRPRGSNGWSVGLTASLPLFDGGERRNRARAAGLDVERRRIEREELRARLEVDLRTELTSYTNARRLTELEEENVELANEALRISLEQFRLASITSTQLRDSQRIVLDAAARLIGARFDAKVAETEILRLTGLLGDRLGF